ASVRRSASTLHQSRFPTSLAGEPEVRRQRSSSSPPWWIVSLRLSRPRSRARSSPDPNAGNHERTACLPYCPTLLCIGLDRLSGRFSPQYKNVLVRICPRAPPEAALLGTGANQHGGGDRSAARRSPGRRI